MHGHVIMCGDIPVFPRWGLTACWEVWFGGRGLGWWWVWLVRFERFCVSCCPLVPGEEIRRWRTLQYIILGYSSITCNLAYPRPATSSIHGEL